MNICTLSLIVLLAQASGWETFESTTYQWMYHETLKMEVQVPLFDNAIKTLEGKEIALTGHYLPFNIAENSIVLSKLPYAACFFCGGDVGPESVVEVQFDDTHRRFQMDEILTISGKLVLNKGDYDHMIFIVAEATELKKDN